MGVVPLLLIVLTMKTSEGNRTKLIPVGKVQTLKLQQSTPYGDEIFLIQFSWHTLQAKHTSGHGLRKLIMMIESHFIACSSSRAGLQVPFTPTSEPSRDPETVVAPSLAPGAIDPIDRSTTSPATPSPITAEVRTRWTVLYV